MTPEVAITLAVAVLGLIGSIYAAISNRNTSAMQSADEIANAANSLLEPLNKRIQELEEKYTALKAAYEVLESEKKTLVKQVNHLQAALDESSVDYQAQIMNAETDHRERFATMKADYEGQIKNLQQQLNKAKNEIAALKMREGQLRNRLNRIKGELDTGPLGEGE